MDFLVTQISLFPTTTFFKKFRQLKLNSTFLWKNRLGILLSTENSLIKKHQKAFRILPWAENIMVDRFKLATKSVGLFRHQSSCLWVFEVFAHRGQATTLPTVEGAAATVPAPPPPPPSLFSCPGCPLTIVMIIGIVIIAIITLLFLPLGNRFRFILS